MAAYANVSDVLPPTRSAQSFGEHALKWAFGAAGVLALMMVSGAVGHWLGESSAEAQPRIIPEHREFTVIGEAPYRSVFFKGTWDIEGPEKSAFPKSVVEFECHEIAPDRRCTFGEAVVHQNGLSVDVGTASIDRWEPERLVLLLPGDCRSTRIVVDLATEEVTGITTDSAERSARCVFPPLQEPRKTRLIDGFDRFFDEKFPDRDH